MARTVRGGMSSRPSWGQQAYTAAAHVASTERGCAGVPVVAA
jgi:hypothetical protein